MDSGLANHINNLNSLCFFSIDHFHSPFTKTTSSDLHTIIVRWIGQVYSRCFTDEYTEAREAKWCLIARWWQGYNLNSGLLNPYTRSLPPPCLVPQYHSCAYIYSLEGTRSQVPCQRLQWSRLSGNHSNCHAACSKWDHWAHTGSQDLSYKRRGIFHRGPLSVEFPSPGLTRPWSIGPLSLCKPHHVELASCDW